MNGEHSNAHAPLATDRQLHTPGPWTLQELDGDEVYMIGLPQKVGFKVVAEVTFGYDEPWDTQQHANARLIAAAPDLLASLKEMGDWIAAGLQASDKAWPDARCLKHTEEIAARARAAVDKAEGWS